MTEEEILRALDAGCDPYRALCNEAAALIRRLRSQLTFGVVLGQRDDTVFDRDARAAMQSLLTLASPTFLAGVLDKAEPDAFLRFARLAEMVAGAMAERRVKRRELLNDEGDAHGKE
jgi:hypothetical protein